MKAAIITEHQNFKAFSRPLNRGSSGAASQPEFRPDADSSSSSFASAADRFRRLGLRQPVRIMGMSNRPELEGVTGEVVRAEPDEHGRVYVRLNKPEPDL